MYFLLWIIIKVWKQLIYRAICDQKRMKRFLSHAPFRRNNDTQHHPASRFILHRPGFHPHLLWSHPCSFQGPGFQIWGSIMSGEAPPTPPPVANRPPTTAWWSLCQPGCSVPERGNSRMKCTHFYTFSLLPPCQEANDPHLSGLEKIASCLGVRRKREDDYTLNKGGEGRRFRNLQNATLGNNCASLAHHHSSFTGFSPPQTLVTQLLFPISYPVS